jgi:hypothetical protein
MNAHIINCQEHDFKSFIRTGYIGVGIVVKGQLFNACRTSYSMYADMKTIRPGDMIFIHAGQKIYGVFKAATEFLEDPSAPPIYLSKNIHFYPDPKKPNSGWKNKSSLPSVGKYRRIAITHFMDKNGRNLCFEEGFDANEVFELKQKKRIWSIPERWKYTDAARTIRPLMEYEALELLKLLERENSDTPKRRKIKPMNLSKYIPIQFILNPNIVKNEKIIEGWMLENIGRNRSLDNALGPLTCFGNNVPIGYLKFVDIFGYQQLSADARKYKVIEVKKDESIFPDDINQLLSYIDWVVENIAQGDHKLVEGLLIAKNFDSVAIDFVKNFDTITKGRKIKLIKFDYVPPTFSNLMVQRVV